MLSVASNVLTHYKQTLLVAYITQLTLSVLLLTNIALFIICSRCLNLHNVAICHACMHLSYFTAGVVDTV